jgi:hypothetical protein
MENVSVVEGWHGPNPEIVVKVFPNGVGMGHVMVMRIVVVVIVVPVVLHQLPPFHLLQKFLLPLHGD